MPIAMNGFLNTSLFWCSAALGKLRNRDTAFIKESGEKMIRDLIARASQKAIKKKELKLPLKDLSLCSDIIKACESAFQGSGRVTFICGQAGVCALGAVVARESGDEKLCHHYIEQFKEVVYQVKLSKDLPDKLLYGRAGFLWACSFLNKNVGENTISSARMRDVVDEIIKTGRQMGNGRCPLMYEWHGKKHWGAAHGLAGVMNVLMDMDLKPDEVEHVKGTLRYMIKNRFPSGNYPSSEGSETDRLVYWKMQFL
ncbi:hypothetical protein ACS0TY_035944 [Phlomoides rotata]